MWLGNGDIYLLFVVKVILNLFIYLFFLHTNCLHIPNLKGANWSKGFTNDQMLTFVDKTNFSPLQDKKKGSYQV